MERLDDKAIMVLLPTGAVRLACRSLSAPGSSVGSVGSVGFAHGRHVEFHRRASRRLSDDALMALVADGDPHAFALLHERHVCAAVALATQMCSRRVIAEEVAQEAFLSFWRSRRHFDRGRGSVRTWILGIVRNRAIDVLRQGVATWVGDESEQGLEELLVARELTDGEVSRRERARELRAALDGLPPEQSRVIALAYYGGYTHTEIATMLDTPVGTVKGRMRLGLRKMAVSVPAAI